MLFRRDGLSAVLIGVLGFLPWVALGNDNASSSLQLIPELPTLMGWALKAPSRSPEHPHWQNQGVADIRLGKKKSVILGQEILSQVAWQQWVDRNSFESTVEKTYSEQATESYDQYLRSLQETPMAMVALGKILDHEIEKRGYSLKVSETRVDYVVQTILNRYAVAADKVKTKRVPLRDEKGETVRNGEGEIVEEKVPAEDLSRRPLAELYAWIRDRSWEGLTAEVDNLWQMDSVIDWKYEDQGTRSLHRALQKEQGKWPEIRLMWACRRGANGNRKDCIPRSNGDAWVASLVKSLYGNGLLTRTQFKPRESMIRAHRKIKELLKDDIESMDEDLLQKKTDYSRLQQMALENIRYLNRKLSDPGKKDWPLHKMVEAAKHVTRVFLWEDYYRFRNSVRKKLNHHLRILVRQRVLDQMVAAKNPHLELGLELGKTTEADLKKFFNAFNRERRLVGRTLKGTAWDIDIQGSGAIEFKKSLLGHLKAMDEYYSGLKAGVNFSCLQGEKLATWGSGTKKCAYSNFSADQVNKMQENARTKDLPQMIKEMVNRAPFREYVRTGALTVKVKKKALVRRVESISTENPRKSDDQMAQALLSPVLERTLTFPYMVQEVSAGDHYRVGVFRDLHMDGVKPLGWNDPGVFEHLSQKVEENNRLLAYQAVVEQLFRIYPVRFLVDFNGAASPESAKFGTWLKGDFQPHRWAERIFPRAVLSNGTMAPWKSRENLAQVLSAKP